MNKLYLTAVKTKREVRQNNTLSYSLYSAYNFSYSQHYKEQRIQETKCAEYLYTLVLVYTNNTIIILELQSNLNTLIDILFIYNGVNNVKISITKLVLITVSRAKIPNLGFKRLHKRESITLKFLYTQSNL